MADTTVSSANRVQQWADKYFVEYVRTSRFSKYMGMDENSIIQVKEELTKQAGDRITLSIVSRLTGAGVTGDSTLKGNEEQLGNYGHLLTVNQLRNGVVVGEYEQIKSKIDLLNAAKTMLKLWSQEQLRDLIIARMQSPVTDGLTTYAAATEAQKDAWDLANNPSTANQRVLFGTAKANDAANDHSANLSNIDGTNDDLHQDIVSLAKRLAKTADPHIRPVRGEEADDEFYVLFCGSLPFRDLQQNMSTVLQNSAPRERALENSGNPLFSGGDLYWDGVIIHEVPEIPVIAGVGAGAIDVSPAFFCGAQALGLAWAARPEPRLQDDDYQNRRGVAIREIRGCEKLNYAVNGAGPFQNGMVTVYCSAVGD